MGTRSTGLRQVAKRLRTGATEAVANAFFHGISSFGKLYPGSRPEAHGIELLSDIPYLSTGRAEHRLDIYRPRHVRGPMPIVLYLHGGAFRMLSKDTHWLMGLMFARAGYLVFNVSYRLAPQFPFPYALEDACDALVWLSANAAKFGGDTSRVVFAGESAGANLAAALSIATCYVRKEPFAKKAFATGIVPRAAVLGCGILQVSDPGRFARRRKLSRWVRGVLEDIHHGYLGDVVMDTDLADPLLVLERGEAPVRPLPACFAFAGTKDPILDDTRRLKVALDRLGVINEVQICPGELHAFHAIPLLPAARAVWRDKLAFLARYVAKQELAA
jgi:acetyl esterase